MTTLSDKKASQYEETSNTTSTLAVCLAVIIPVIFVGAVVGYFAWRAYKKNKKESLDDDDPDFNGDNIVLPDMPAPGNTNGGEGGYAFAASNIHIAGAKAIRRPRPAAANPFNDSGSSQMSLSHTLHNHDAVESIVLPYADETGSKRSLEELNRQFGGEYGGYSLSERKIENEQASAMHSFASKSNLSVSKLGKTQTHSGSNLAVEQVWSDDKEDAESDKNSSINYRDPPSPPKQAVVHNKGAVVPLMMKNQNRSYADEKPTKHDSSSDSDHYNDATHPAVGAAASAMTKSNSEASDYDMKAPARYAATQKLMGKRVTSGSSGDSNSKVQQPPVTHTQPLMKHTQQPRQSPFGDEHSDKYHSSDTTSTHSMSQVAYQTPSESVSQTPSSEMVKGLNFSNEHVGETAGPAIELTGASPSKSENTEKSDVEDAEEEEQIDRMKSVYKVYFSRDSVYSGKSSRNSRFEADGDDVPPLPKMPAGMNVDGTENKVEDNSSVDGARQLTDGQSYQNYDEHSHKAEAPSFQQSTNDEQSYERSYKEGYEPTQKSQSAQAEHGAIPQQTQSQHPQQQSAQSQYPDQESQYPDQESQYPDQESQYPESSAQYPDQQYNQYPDQQYQQYPDQQNSSQYPPTQQQFQPTAQNQPPTQELPRAAPPTLTVNTDMSGGAAPPAQNVNNDSTTKLTPGNNEAGNRMSTASYSSSVYVPVSGPDASTPVAKANSNEGYYPHQQIQYMMEQQQRQQMQMQQSQAAMARQMSVAPYGYGYPGYGPQMAQPGPQMAPRVLGVKKRSQKLEKLPLPHQFSKRNSTLETFTEFTNQNGLPRSVRVTTPHGTPNLEQMQWSQTNANPSPHEFDDSMLIHSPIEVPAKKHYMPNGSFEKQIHKIASSPSLNQLQQPNRYGQYPAAPASMSNLVPM